MTARPCPICDKPSTVESRPFCSPRCADLDLQRWFTGRYAVPGTNAADQSTAQDEED